MKSLKAIRQLVRDTLHQFVRFPLHPIWSYSLPQIFAAVKRDWDAETLYRYGGQNGRREWWSGGTWLHEGDEVQVVNKPNTRLSGES